MSVTRVMQSIAGGFDKSNLTALDNSDTSNFLVETSTTDRVVTKYLRSICGSDAVITGGNFRALHWVNDTLYAVKDDEFGIVSLTDNTFHKIVSVNSSHDISIVNSGVPTPWVFVSDGSYLYACNTTQTIGEQQANYKTITCPPNSKPSSLAFTYGWLVMLDEDTGKCFYSLQYPYDKEYTYKGWEADDIFGLKITDSEGTLLNPEGAYFLCEYKPDKTLRLHVAKNAIIAVGDHSMQAITYNGGSFFDQPWSASFSTAVSYGGDLSVEMEDIVYSYSKDKGVWAYDGSTASKVSTLDVDRAMRNETPVRAFKVVIDGHDLACFQFSSTTFAFDGAWIRLESLVNGNNVKWRYNAAVRVNEDTYIGRDGALAKLNVDKFTEDDGAPIRRYRRGKIWTRNGNLIQLDQVRILMNVGQTSRLVDNGVMHVSFTRDGASVGVTKELPLPKTGQYNKDLRLYRMGVGRSWDISLECSDDAPIAIYSVETAFDDTIGEGE